MAGSSAGIRNKQKCPSSHPDERDKHPRQINALTNGVRERRMARGRRRMRERRTTWERRRWSEAPHGVTTTAWDTSTFLSSQTMSSMQQ
jgi:hypothetical protein